MTRDEKNLVESVSLEHRAISPLDGRYAAIGQKLAPYFSEYALAKNRVKVEVKWLEFLVREIKDIWSGYSWPNIKNIKSIYEDFDDSSYIRVKEIEAVTNHDVKAVEIFVDEKLKEMGLEKLISFVHIGCTSEDITNPSYANMIASALKEVWVPAAEELIYEISKIAVEHADTAMLAHTHGQPATPTTVGKEMTVHVYRLRQSLDNIKSIKTRAKFNGATGNYAAISVAFPNEYWPQLSKLFIKEYLGFEFNPVTTQIEGHDYVCYLMDSIRHFNNILRDFDTDMWSYLNREYFKQVEYNEDKRKISIVSFFENSEANVKIGNGICSVFSDELPRSRLQRRDLSNSSLLLNIGLAFGYSLQAIEQTIGGLKKVAVNEKKIAADLDSKWEVLAEPIQTMLRKYGISDAYNQLKELTRGKSITKEAIQEFIESLDVLSDEDKNKLLELTPAKYVGYAAQLTKKYN